MQRLWYHFGCLSSLAFVSFKSYVRTKASTRHHFVTYRRSFRSSSLCNSPSNCGTSCQSGAFFIGSSNSGCLGRPDSLVRFTVVADCVSFTHRVRRVHNDFGSHDCVASSKRRLCRLGTLGRCTFCNTESDYNYHANNHRVRTSDFLSVSNTTSCRFKKYYTSTCQGESTIASGTLHLCIYHPNMRSVLYLGGRYIK